jgi:hypothetical protein
MSTSFASEDVDQDDDERASSAQLIAELQEQVQRAEQASDQCRKQLEHMQKKLDEYMNEQTNAEVRDFQRQTLVDQLQADAKDNSRLRRDMELAHESEKKLLLAERERQANRESELQSVIGRLNETLRNRGLERTATKRAGMAECPCHANTRLTLCSQYAYAS